MWFADIDWADRRHEVAVIDEAGRLLGKRQVAHAVEGLQDLTEFLTAICGPERRAEMACISETNHGLLITALLAAGFAGYPVNPATIDRRRAASGAKTDSLDAYRLPKTGRAEFADLRRLEPESPQLAELKALTRDQDALLQMQTRLVNQLTACLKASYPVARSLFSKLQQRSTLLFLQAFPPPEQAQGASREQIAPVKREAGHPQPTKVAPTLLATLQEPHLRADAVPMRTQSRRLLALVAPLLPLIEEIAAYDKEITRLFLRHADSPIFQSLPGAGKRLAPRRFSECGEDRTRSQDAGSLQALAGSSPVLYASGTYAKPHRR